MLRVCFLHGLCQFHHFNRYRWCLRFFGGRGYTMEGKFLYVDGKTSMTKDDFLEFYSGIYLWKKKCFCRIMCIEYSSQRQETDIMHVLIFDSLLYEL